MTEEWTNTFETPQMRAFMKLAEAQFSATGPEGSSVTVDSTGAVLDATFGTSDLPGAVASDLVVAYNQAADQALATASAIGRALPGMPKELLEELDKAGQPYNADEEELVRAESENGRVLTAVDPNQLRLASIYLEDLSEETRQSIPEAIDRAFAKARGIEGPTIGEKTADIMQSLNQRMAKLEGNLEDISSRVSQAMRNLG